MANDLVVQLGAKLDQFQSDMNQAGELADAAIARVERDFAASNAVIMPVVTKMLRRLDEQSR